MKYFIYSNPRCASTMLSDSLNCCGELFGRQFKSWRDDFVKNVYGISFDDMLINDKGVWLIDQKYDLSPFLDVADNFKLIHLHVSKESNLYNELISRGYKCISLQRNLWKSCISFKLAKESGVWHVDSPYKQDKSIIFPIEEIEWFFDLYSTKNQIDMKFSDVLHVEYEDICNDWEKVASRISKYLSCDIPKNKFHSKRTVRNPESLILNYQEIFSHFQNTIYSDLFPKPLLI